MNIIDYDIIKNENKILIFLKVIEHPDEIGMLRYKTLNNIIYKISNGFCVTDRRGAPLVIRDSLEMCAEFLNEEYNRMFTVVKELVLSSDET
jgi:hypothetical protein